MRCWLSSLWLALSIDTGVQAQTVAESYAALDRGDYPTAFSPVWLQSWWAGCSADRLAMQEDYYERILSLLMISKNAQPGGVGFSGFYTDY